MFTVFIHRLTTVRDILTIEIILISALLQRYTFD